jgi:hypothetical protein
VRPLRVTFRSPKPGEECRLSIRRATRPSAQGMAASISTIWATAVAPRDRRLFAASAPGRLGIDASVLRGDRKRASGPRRSPSPRCRPASSPSKPIRGRKSAESVNRSARRCGGNRCDMSAHRCPSAAVNPEPTAVNKLVLSVRAVGEPRASSTRPRFESPSSALHIRGRTYCPGRHSADLSGMDQGGAYGSATHEIYKFSS